ncbi:putative transposase [Burkholderia cepacia GG4]|uniref:Transposase n=1 Tax=Burkholderia cepacia GG4 TaxID=1009846 RepID=A0A9W3K6K3_BURCE|nr:putative transposase [Burkholderia cepacia GG4]
MEPTVVGVDIAKRVFQLRRIAADTGEVFDRQLRRSDFLEHFANREPCLIGMAAARARTIDRQMGSRESRRGSAWRCFGSTALRYRRWRALPRRESRDRCIDYTVRLKLRHMIRLQAAMPDSFADRFMPRDTTR